MDTNRQHHLTGFDGSSNFDPLIKKLTTDKKRGTGGFNISQENSENMSKPCESIRTSPVGYNPLSSFHFNPEASMQDRRASKMHYSTITENNPAPRDWEAIDNLN